MEPDLWRKNLYDIETQIRELQNDIAKLAPEFRAEAISDLDLSLSVSIHETLVILRKNGDTSSNVELAEDAFYRFMLFQQNEIIKEIIRGNDAGSGLDRLRKLTQDFSTAFPVFRKLTENGSISAAIFYARSSEFIEEEVISVCQLKTEGDTTQSNSVEGIVLEVLLESEPSDFQNDISAQINFDKIREILSAHKKIHDKKRDK